MKKYKIIPHAGAVRIVEAHALDVSNSATLIYLVSESGEKIAVIPVDGLVTVVELDKLQS